LHDIYCVPFCRRNIELLKVSDTADKVMTGQVQSRGNLMYKTEKNLKPIPVVMINLNDPVPKANLQDYTHKYSTIY